METLYQDGRLYVRREEKYRHIVSPGIAEKMLGPGWENFPRGYPSGSEIQSNLGKSITEWPEKAAEEYPFKGLQALLALNPKPDSAQQIRDLGFNAADSYAGDMVNWVGDYISIQKGRPGPVILRFTGDEFDCHKHDPEIELDIQYGMQQETPNIPVGFNLEGSLGCGLADGYESVAAYQEAVIKVANQAAYVSLNVYPYRKDWPNAVEAMEEKYNFWVEKLTVPIIIVVQAHWGYGSEGSKLTKPDAMEQVRFWFSKGIYGYIVYCWADEWHGVRDSQNEWREANAWAKENIQ